MTARPRQRFSRRCARSARRRGACWPSGATAWAHPRARPGGRLPRDGRGHAHPLPADRGAAGAADGPDGDRDRRGRARARAAQRGARRHVGWFLLREVLGAPERRRDGGWYIAAVVVGTLFLSLLLGFATKSVSGAVLLLIPVSEVVKGLLDAVLLRVTKPRFVPRLALRRGIPPEGRTLCVIAALLTSPDDAHALCARLEEYYLCNRDALGQLTFGLLADLPEADMAHAPIDPAILRAARGDRRAQRALGQPVLSLHTPSRTNPDGKWSAWGASAARYWSWRGWCSTGRARCSAPPGLRRA
ncbi:MAG: hypothetical protein ACLSHG_00085 [Oscillospiraceae bacterium]